MQHVFTYAHMHIHSSAHELIKHLNRPGSSEIEFVML